MSNNKKILITGANGFVGSHLVRTLSNIRNTELYLAARSITNKFHYSQKVFLKDVSTTQNWYDVLIDVDCVIHCAARVHVMNELSSDPLAEFRRINVEGTMRLAQQAAEVGVQRFIFISSIKVNGETNELGQTFTADDVPAPQDPYGVSKMEAELSLRELSAQSGMEVVIIRPPLVYGYGVKANFASMMRWLSKGIPLPLGGVTSNRRSLVYVENLVDLIRVCVDHPKAANQTFLVSDGEDVSTTTLLRRMAKALGCPARLISLSPTLIKLAAKCIGKMEVADRLCGSLQVDITKTKELLGWKPKFSLDDGLSRTALPIVSGCNK